MATALLEFYSDSSETGKDIALKIFELGLKTCIQEPAYVLSYLDFLGHFNDDNSTLSSRDNDGVFVSPFLSFCFSWS